MNCHDYREFTYPVGQNAFLWRRMGTATEKSMGTQQNEPRSIVRSTWLKAVVDASQRIAGQCALIDADEVHQTVGSVLD